MASSPRRWLPIVAGIVVLVGIVAIGVMVASVVWLRDQATVNGEVSAEHATSAFIEAAKAFPDPRPAIAFDEDGRPRLLDHASERHNPGKVTTLRALAWDPRERALATITLPLWLLRLKSGPIRFGEYVSGLDDRGVSLTADDIAKFGPGVVFDYSTPAGRRVLLLAQ